jgi:hypothetical protein
MPQKSREQNFHALLNIMGGGGGDQILEDEMGGAYCTHGRDEKYKMLIVKPEGKRPLGRPRCRWEDNIRRDLGESGWKCAYWMHLAQYMDQWRALVNTAKSLGEY